MAEVAKALQERKAAKAKFTRKKNAFFTAVAKKENISIRPDWLYRCTARGVFESIRFLFRYIALPVAVRLCRHEVICSR